MKTLVLPPVQTSQEGPEDLEDQEGPEDLGDQYRHESQEDQPNQVHHPDQEGPEDLEDQEGPEDQEDQPCHEGQVGHGGQVDQVGQVRSSQRLPLCPESSRAKSGTRHLSARTTLCRPQPGC